MDTNDVGQRRIAEYYQAIDRELNVPKTGLLTTVDNQARIKLEEAADRLLQISKLVEVYLGQGLLSRDIRSTAERLVKQINNTLA